MDIKDLGKKVLGPDLVKKYRNEGVKGLLNLPEKKINIGFIGCGTHATQNIYPSLRYAPINLKAVCARTAESAKRNAKLFGADAFYTDYKLLLARPDLDAVFIVVNQNLHSELCIQALEAGKHVFIEKPPANNQEEINKISEVSKRTGKFVMVGFQKRFAPTYRKTKELIEEEFTPTYISTKFCVGPVEDERALIHDVGIHHFDLIQFLMGPIKSLNFEKNITNNQTNFIINLKFESGAIGSMQISSQQFWNKPNERIEIQGDKESIIIDNLINWYHHKDSNEKPGFLQPEGTFFWQPNFSIPSDENQTFFLNGFAYEIKHFAESVLKNKKPENSIENSFKTFILMDQILGKHDV
tara:strand:- start:1038 stop:2102 length:1065 start_codon:yes stop_codon:yes gene_type:complete